MRNVPDQHYPPAADAVARFLDEVRQTGMYSFVRWYEVRPYLPHLSQDEREAVLRVAATVTARFPDSALSA